LAALLAALKALSAAVLSTAVLLVEALPSAEEWFLSSFTLVRFLVAIPSMPVRFPAVRPETLLDVELFLFWPFTLAAELLDVLVPLLAERLDAPVPLLAERLIVPVPFLAERAFAVLPLTLLVVRLPDGLTL